MEVASVAGVWKVASNAWSWARRGMAWPTRSSGGSGWQGLQRCNHLAARCVCCSLLLFSSQNVLIQSYKVVPPIMCKLRWKIYTFYGNLKLWNFLKFIFRFLCNFKMWCLRSQPIFYMVSFVNNHLWLPGGKNMQKCVLCIWQFCKKKKVKIVTRVMFWLNLHGIFYFHVPFPNWQVSMENLLYTQW